MKRATPKKLISLMLILAFTVLSMPITANAIDDYPAKWKDAKQDSLVDDWGMYNRQCTSWVAWCLSSRNGYKFDRAGKKSWNAYLWGPNAREMGITVNNTPAVGAVAWWDKDSIGGGYGHVGWVSEVYGNSAYIEHYNSYLMGEYSWSIVSVYDPPTAYIHFKDIKSTGSYYPAAKMSKVTDNIKITNEFTELTDYNDPPHFSEGLAAMWKNGKWGYIDKTGKVVIPYIYDGAYGFNEGLTRVQKDGKWGYIDKTGKAVIAFTYDDAYGFNDGLARVKKNGKWGYIDKTGKLIIPCEYDDEYWDNNNGFNEGLSAMRKNGKWGYIDKTGKAVIPFIYDEAYGFNNGLARVAKNGKVGYIDKTGKVVISFIYDSTSSDFSDGLARVRKETDGKTGYIDKTGKVVIPIEFDWAESFSEGLAAVAKNGKWGYIDKTGKVIIPYKYNDAESFSNGLAVVQEGFVQSGSVKMHYIDKTGKIVLTYENQGNLSEYGRLRSFNNGIAVYVIQVSIMYDRGYGILQITKPTAKPVTTKILVNNKEVNFSAYTIYDDTYFNIRDIAHILNGTKKQFSVSWDSSLNARILKTGQPYKATGDEMKAVGSGEKVSSLLENKVFLDGKNTPFTMYAIDGQHYFNLEELSKALGFDAEYDYMEQVYKITTGESTATTAKLSATPTASTVLVNGKNVAFDAYNIEDSNYFKLRDLAYVLNGTEKQFEVGYDGANNAITLLNGKSYTAVGGEMSSKGTGNKTPTATTAKIYVDGKEVSFTAYNIDGNNYFKLRDIGEMFNFGVEWDGAKNTIVIDTSIVYTP